MKKIIKIAVAIILKANQHTELITENVAKQCHNADKCDDPQNNTENGSGLLTHKTHAFRKKMKCLLVNFIITYLFRFVNSLSVFFINYSAFSSETGP